MRISWVFFLFTFVGSSYAATINKPMVINLAPTDTHFQVVLPANPTTGFEWTLHNYNKVLLRLVTSRFNPPASTLMGAAGSRVFVFELIPGAAMPKVTALVFNYAQPWERQEGKLQTVIIHFNVSATKTP